MKKALSRLVAGLMAGVLCISLCPSPAKAASSVSVKTKYLYSGAAHAKYTNLAYYAEPVVADINKDGRDEVVSVSFAITVTDAQSGKTLWQVDSGKDRSTPYNSEPSAHYSGAWCSPVVKDIDGDGYVEIISTHKISSLCWITTAISRRAGPSIWKWTALSVLWPWTTLTATAPVRSL